MMTHDHSRDPSKTNRRYTNDTRCTNDPRNCYSQQVKNFMRLTREYYTLSYRNYCNISGYESHDDPRNPPLFHDGSVGSRALPISGQIWGVNV